MSGSRLRISVLPGSCSLAVGRIWLELSVRLPEVGFGVNTVAQVTTEESCSKKLDNVLKQRTKITYSGRFAGNAKTGSSSKESHLLGLVEALCLFAQ